MKTKLPVIVLCLSFFHASPVLSQVHLAGSLSGILTDTTYIVEDSIFVAADDSLIINPGADFFFNGPYKFEIFGYLYAVGTIQDSIRFQMNPGADTLWNSIIFRIGSSQDSRLSYCLITNAFGSAVNCYQVNITISNCTITQNSANWGGGIYCSGSNALISNCVITDNQCKNNGGGIYCTNSSPIISNCLISGNLCNTSPTTSSGRGGGGICANHSSSPTIRGCVLEDNHSIWNGGGISINDNSHPAIMDCAIFNNSADSCGGGIFCSSSSHPSVIRTFLHNNGAVFDGGGVYLTDQANMSLESCTIGANNADGMGGGVAVVRSRPYLQKSVFFGNSGTFGGGGIWGTDSSDVQITNCTFAGNSGQYGGGILCGLVSNFLIVNNILWENDPDEIYPGATSTSEVIYCDIQGGYFGTGNINSDPQFIDFDQHDYRLQWGSPCIDAGHPDSIYTDPDGTIADIGAFYYDQSNPVRILLTPYNAPHLLPNTGGAFDFEIRLSNSGMNPVTVTAWCDVTLPGGSHYGPTVGPVTLSLPAGAQLARTRTQNVPSFAAPGLYHYNAYASSAVATSSDAFIFVKLAGEGVSAVGSWFNVGEEWEASNTGAQNLMPHNFALGVYPNPFNPAATLTYTLPYTARVVCEVFDLQGRRIWEDVQSPRIQTAGTHKILFDATQWAAGIYFYRLTINDQFIHGKLLLLK
jgi:predicted outer membrane repeat protein